MRKQSKCFKAQKQYVFWHIVGIQTKKFNEAMENHQQMSRNVLIKILLCGDTHFKNTVYLSLKTVHKLVCFLYWRLYNINSDVILWNFPVAHVTYFCSVAVGRKDNCQNRLVDWIDSLHNVLWIISVYIYLRISAIYL